MSNITGKTRMGGFMASPASHSISPLMYNTAFEALGIDYVYLAFDINQDQLATGIETIRTMNWFGANVSMPNKIKVIEYLDGLSEGAALIGAVNTIVQEDGQLIGHNTDGIGFCNHLRTEGVVIEDTTMTLLGAGGAAAAMVCQAALEGMKAIHIFNRKGANFDAMEEKIQEITAQTQCQVTIHELSDTQVLAQALAASNLLTNATSVGMKAVESPLADLTLLRPDLIVYDAIYHPKETLLLKSAKAVGAQAINGLGMLLYQGAAAFKLYTGQEMPIALIQEVIEADE